MKLKLDNVQRSRLKVTTIISCLLLSMSFFPMYVIIKSLELGDTSSVSAWAAWSAIATTIGMLAGYYVNKETNRPSFVNQTHVNLSQNTGEELGEDYSDPESIPL
jgi:multidrug transporter EmrE-like cation transporter